MKKLQVIVRDRNTLVLEEDALKGDYIDLTSLNNIDLTAIENIIAEGKDKVYEAKLQEKTDSLNKEHELNIKLASEENKALILKKDNEIKELKKQNEYALKQKESVLKNEYNMKILELEKTIQSFNQLKDKEIAKIESDHLLKDEQKKNQFEKELSKLNHEIEQLTRDKEEILKNNALELEIKKKSIEVEYKEKLHEQKESFIEELRKKDDLIHEKENEYNMLQRQRAALNVKQTGEDLEAWCDNEMISYMQNGLFNCTWNKDNIVTKDEDEIKGSKADYIFKVYASDSHLEDELLTSVCLDMKDENPDSVNKKKNSNYYKDLDKNRRKKNCKYAVLVSNLEMDRPNDLPIFKVNEYEDMYVVRPAYMMTFLNMLASLSKRFSELILADTAEKLEVKNMTDLMDEFESIKKTYLDKPLSTLKTDITKIKTSNESIMKSAKAIEEVCDKITRSYLEDIERKLETFTIKLEKENKKYNKKVLIVSK